jgi:hypothetical protein
MSGGSLALGGVVTSSPFPGDPLGSSPVSFSGAMALAGSQMVSNGGAWVFSGPVSVSFGGYLTGAANGATYLESPAGGVFSLSLTGLTPGPLAGSSAWVGTLEGLVNVAGIAIELSAPSPLGNLIDSGGFGPVGVSGVAHVVATPEPVTNLGIGLLLLFARRWKKGGEPIDRN